MYANFGNGYFGTTAVSSAGTNASNNGIFEYDVPTGYTALSTKGLIYNMAYTTINKSTDYFNTKLYTGNGSTTQTITGVGFQPDWFG